jgi:hypothetical protein
MTRLHVYELIGKARGGTILTPKGGPLDGMGVVCDFIASGQRDLRFSEPGGLTAIFVLYFLDAIGSG